VGHSCNLAPYPTRAAFQIDPPHANSAPYPTRAVCQIDPMLFSFFVWLGYMNSFLNPVIYTIFNVQPDS